MVLNYCFIENKEYYFQKKIIFSRLNEQKMAIKTIGIASMIGAMSPSTDAYVQPIEINDNQAKSVENVGGTRLSDDLGDININQRNLSSSDPLNDDIFS